MDRFDEVKERVKEAHDLVQVIESYIPLRQAGRNFSALCPFHAEKTPSFTVHPDAQYFKCYGCGVAGDVFSFLQQKEGWDFRTALEVLAERAGISMEGVFGGGRQRGSSGRQGPYEALAAVSRFLHEQLLGREGQAARSYLESRGLAAGIDSFGLGYHPTARGALRRFAAAQRLPLETLGEAGLVGDNGREPFYGRLMFPIHDERGRVVGFGGRALGEGKPKYINSPESPFFRKRQVLYGLRQAKDAGDRRIVVMEGYTDVIACHLAGFRGAVATLGTALTRDHGKTLIRYARDGVVLLFDGDRAGRAAAEKGYGELMRSEVPARVALLPEGEDPADLLARAASGAEFEGLLDRAEDATAMWFRLKRMRLDLADPAQIKVVVDECSHVLSGIEDEAQRAVLQSRMAQHLGLEEAVLRRSMARRSGGRAERSGGGRGQAEPEQPLRERVETTPLGKSDVELVACVLAAPGLLSQAVDGCPDPGRLEILFDAAVRSADAGAASGDQLLSAMFTAAADAPQLAELLGNAADIAPKLREPDQKLAVLLQHRNSYRARVAAQRTRMELQEAKAAGDRERADELMARYLSQLREQQFG